MPLRMRWRSASRPASTYGSNLEGVSGSVGADTVLKYCNAWFRAVSDAGYVPGIYVGANAGLTGDELYWQLRTKHYWKSGSGVPDIPQRGYCMVQRIKAGDQIGGDRHRPRPDRHRQVRQHADMVEPQHRDRGRRPGGSANRNARRRSGCRRRRDSQAIDTLLPLPAPGVTHHYSADRLDGTRLTIDAILEVGQVWNARRPGALMSIGDISKKGGGELPGHASHREAIDFDMRMMKADGNAAAMLYADAVYSRAVTQELVDLFYGDGILAVKLIFFNDAAVTSIQPWPNHDNHLHVRFYPPGTTSAYPLLQRNAKGAAVRELQRRLGYWSAHNANPCPAPAVDGDFGQNTFDAIVAVQNAARLHADGRAGDEVWRLLPKVR